jgi:hypothetical protein
MRSMSPYVLSLGSVVIALAALVVNIHGIVRRPRIEPHWQANANGDDGLWVTVIGRRRAVEVTGLGVMYRDRTWRRQFPVWQLPKLAVHYGVDARRPPLRDGQSIRQWLQVNPATKERPDAEGCVEYCFVIASDRAYFVRTHSKVRDWLASVG